jgi:hypothetical protein
LAGAAEVVMLVPTAFGAAHHATDDADEFFGVTAASGPSIDATATIESAHLPIVDDASPEIGDLVTAKPPAIRRRVAVRSYDMTARARLATATPLDPPNMVACRYACLGNHGGRWLTVPAHPIEREIEIGTRAESG